jgi:Na+-transporting methylmalonyl-CoA/oxaloacetate decarboxylase gamma subunit
MVSASDVLGYAYVSEVLMLLVCGMIIASGVINMEVYNRVGTAKGKDEVEKKNNIDYMEMANTMYAIDTTAGAGLAALILAMMTYQVGKGSAGVGSAGSKGSNYVQHIFASLAYIALIMNSAYGLNVYKKAASFVAKGDCVPKLSDRPMMPPAVLRQRAMMSARARALGDDKAADKTDDMSAAHYAKRVNDTNIAFIVTSSIIFAVYIGYIGYSSGYFKKSGGLAGGAFSEFFAY